MDSVVDELEEGIPVTEPPALAGAESSATVAMAVEAARESPTLETIHSGESAPRGQQQQQQQQQRQGQEEEEEAKAAGPGEAARAGAEPAGCLASVRRGLTRAWAGFLLVFGDLLTWPFFLFLVSPRCILYNT